MMIYGLTMSCKKSQSLMPFFLLMVMFLWCVPSLAFAQTLALTPPPPTNKIDPEANLLAIDVTARANDNDAVKAKTAALTEGERQAFYAALVQLSPKNAKNIYRQLRGQDFSSYVDSFTIKREVAKAAFYEADITYRFYREKLDRIVGAERGLNAVNDVPTGNGLLIISPYDTGSELILFEQGNLWRGMLNNVVLEVGQGVLVMPFGDPRDQHMLGQQELLAGMEPQMSKLALRYGTRNVVIATAKSRTYNELPMVEVRLHKVGGNAEDDIIMNFRGKSPLDTLDLVMAEAARATSLRLLESIRDYSLFTEQESDKRKALVLRAEYKNGRQWRRIQEALNSLPSLEKLVIGTVELSAAQATLIYRGNPATIQKALLARGLQADTSRDYWVITLP
jgi:hypothetical protein